MRIANSLQAQPLLTVIGFYFGKDSVQRVFLAFNSSHLIKLLKTTTTKCITLRADQSFGKQPDKSAKNRCRNSCPGLTVFRTWMCSCDCCCCVGLGQCRPWLGDDLSHSAFPCLHLSPFQKSPHRCATETMLLPLLLDLCFKLLLHFSPYSVRWGAEWLPLYPAGWLVNGMSACMVSTPVLLAACAASCPWPL